ncbi:MAG TPA: PLP-dependent aspartate aminotransferase family protein [Erysipelotrichaceae bacterium]|nr:PLP-dependent aspartate aminotransferase family protein [Erysipelotrichaceae bacterium]
MKIETLLIHGGSTEDELTGSVNVPIYQTSTFKQEGLGQNRGFEYARTKNPTRSALERLIAQLEEGDEGFAFSSGMAAITTVLSLFSQGDKILISDNLYGGSYRVLDKVFKRFGIMYSMVDTTNLELFKKEMNNTYQAVLIETPTNPLLGISDIEEISKNAHENNAIVIVDNTFMSPYLQKPIKLGADIVIHSGTKYLGGHSDLIAGLVITKSPELSQRIAFLQNAMGAILGPQDSFLLIRGIKTLALRMDRHIENTNEVLKYLVNNDHVKKVFHPNLTSHQNYQISLKQAKSGGAMVSFELNQLVDVNIFLSSLRVITLAESLGGVESLISHPATMTHASYPKEHRELIGISDNLVRLSIGIEHYQDLIDDINSALKKAVR